MAALPAPAPQTPGALGPQRLAHRQQQLEWLASAVLRALGHEGGLSFRARHARAADGSALPWTAPHLRTEPADGLETWRAAADGLALRHGRNPSHRAAVHAAHVPDGTLARTLYEWFEQLRLEALVPESWPGVRHNLQRHFERWTLRYHDSPLIESQLGLLLFSVSQMVWSRLQRRAPPEEVVDTMEATRAGLHPLLGDALHQMSRNRQNPDAFAPASAHLALTVARLIQDAQAQAQRFPADRRVGRDGDFFLWLDDEADAEPVAALAPSGDSRTWQMHQGRYQVFTRQFDRTLSAAARVRAALLADYRNQLDRRLQTLSLPLPRLARQLEQALARPTDSGWISEQESGRIDGRLLTRVLSAPLDRRVFKQWTQPPRTDGALCLLMDCSGSMKAHAEPLALFAEICSRIAGMAQLPCEVLGFTTGGWNGGQARRHWLRAGRPPLPGRLAERQHLVFKDFGTRWQRARPAFASLLKLDLYREGLDGEAVAWATERLLARAESRRILLVVSDGCPMEAATQQQNDPFYLDNHLKACVRQALQQGVQVIGIGLGLDLSPFYPQHLALEPDKLLHTASLQALLQAIARPKWR